MNNKKKNTFIALCVIPTLILFSLFVIYPTMRVFFISFYRWSGISNNPVFVGLENYRNLLQDKTLGIAFRNTIFLMVIVPIVTMIFALILAVLLTEGKVRGKNFYRINLFFPNVLSMVVISVLWSQIYHPTMGIINKLLGLVGLDSLQHAWLGEGATVMWAIAVTMIWQAVGYYMVLYIAGIDSIPKSLYEAATVDGASGLKRFFYITIPMLWEVIRVTFVFMLSGVLFMSFIISRVMTDGGPNKKSEVLLTYMYSQAFQNANFGYAMAIAVIIFIFVVGLAFTSIAITGRKQYDV